MRRLPIGESVSVPVDPRVLYVPTGLLVSPGERYLFAAGGKWRDWFRDAGPEGWGRNWLADFNRLPGWPFFLLCGSVGRQDRDAFAIGRGAEWTVPQASGDDPQLYLFANDWRFMYWNNKALGEREGGPLQATVTRLA